MHHIMIHDSRATVQGDKSEKMGHHRKGAEDLSVKDMCAYNLSSYDHARGAPWPCMVELSPNGYWL